MDSTEQQLLQDILQELRKINSTNNSYARSFFTGILQALGSFFGTAVFAVAMVYIFSQFSSYLIKPTSHFIESVFKQVNWNLVIPAPKLDLKNIDLQF